MVCAAFSFLCFELSSEERSASNNSLASRSASSSSEELSELLELLPLELLELLEEEPLELLLLLLRPLEPGASWRRVMVEWGLILTSFLRRRRRLEESWGFSWRDCFRARRSEDMAAVAADYDGD